MWKKIVNLSLNSSWHIRLTSVLVSQHMVANISIYRDSLNSQRYHSYITNKVAFLLC